MSTGSAYDLIASGEVFWPRPILSFNLLYPHILIRYYSDEPLTAIISNLLQQISYLPDLYGITDLDTVQRRRLLSQINAEFTKAENSHLYDQCVIHAQAIIDYAALALTLRGVSISNVLVDSFIVDRITIKQLHAANKHISDAHGVILIRTYRD